MGQQIATIRIALALYTLLLIVNLFDCVNGDEGLYLHSSSPTVKGLPIAFYAKYDGSYLMYVFKDKNDASKYQEVQTPAWASKPARAEFLYKDVPETEKSIMGVEVYFVAAGVKLWKLAEGEIPFSITYNLVGSIEYIQDGEPHSVTSRSIVSTNQTTNVRFNLFDPEGYMRNYKKAITWKLNGVDMPNVTTFNFDYRFNVSKLTNLTANVFVTGPDEKAFKRNMELTSSLDPKDEIWPKLKVDGHFFFTRNQSLDLNITCVNGTGPFSFCRGFSHGNTTLPEFKCTMVPIVNNVCFFNVGWYFQNAGDWKLFIELKNDVSVVRDMYTLKVMDFDKRSPLSFVLIPVTSCIFAIVIVISGVAYHLRQRKRFTVEVADFDFVNPDSGYEEKTLMERIKDSFAGTCFMSRRRNSLLGPDDFRDDGYASTSVST